MISKIEGRCSIRLTLETNAFYFKFYLFLQKQEVNRAFNLIGRESNCQLERCQFKSDKARHCFIRLYLCIEIS